MAAFGKSSRRDTKTPVSPENKKRWSFFCGIHGKFSGECMCMSGRLWYVSELALNNKWNGFFTPKKEKVSFKGHLDVGYAVLGQSQ